MITMELRIRHARAGDCPTIASFIQGMLRDMESVGGDPINPDLNFWNTYRERLVELIRKDDRLYLLARTGNRIAGFLEGQINDIHEVFVSKQAFHISVVYVIPEFRQNGIATALVQNALRWASGKGCREADLNVLSDNASARGLYEKLGFEVYRFALRINLPLTAQQKHHPGRQGSFEGK